MTDDPQNQGPLLASLGARRLGVDHYTEHDFEMERIGREQDVATYAERIKTLEAAGWEPSRGPFYYARKEFHGGHLIPGTKKKVPTSVAFAMFLEATPEVELEPYKPHPHGWTPPTTTEGMFHVQQVNFEPMKAPAGLLFYLADSYEYGTEEDKKTRREEKAQRDAAFKGLPGVRSYGESWKAGGEKWVFVVLEAEEYRAGIPDICGGLRVDVRIKAEAEERAEKEARDKAANERYQEEAAWLRKGRDY